LTAVREWVDRLAPGSYAWAGHMQGSLNNSITLSVVDQTPIGSKTIDGYEKHTIRNDGPEQILHSDRVLHCEDGSQIDLACCLHDHHSAEQLR
jgi:hypothetical protein